MYTTVIWYLCIIMVHTQDFTHIVIYYFNNVLLTMSNADMFHLIVHHLLEEYVDHAFLMQSVTTHVCESGY